MQPQQQQQQMQKQQASMVTPASLSSGSIDSITTSSRVHHDVALDIKT
jgi:hypothetical protein